MKAILNRPGTSPKRLSAVLGLTVVTLATLVVGYLLLSRSATGARVQIPASIPADCSRDVTKEINDWIASADDGRSALATKTLMFNEKDSTMRCYRVDGEVFLPGRRYLVLEGHGNTRIDGGLGFLSDDHSEATCEGTHSLTHHCSRKRSQFHLHNGTGLSVQGFEVVGQNKGTGLTFNAETEGQHGFRVEGTQGVKILGNRVYDVWGDYVGLQWGGSPAGSPSRSTQPVRDAIIEANELNDECGRQGISVVAGERIRVINNSIGGCSNAIDLEDETPYWPVRDVTIRGNQIGDVWHGFVGNGASRNECSANRDIRIEGNVMHMANHTAWPPIYFAGKENCIGAGVTVANNTLRVREHGKDGDRAILCEYIDRCEIWNNRVIYEDSPGATAEQPPIKIVGGSASVVSRNDLREWTWVYDKDGVNHGAGVVACGNRLSTASAFSPDTLAGPRGRYSPDEAPLPC